MPKPDNLVERIDFPDDLDAIVSLCTGGFNGVMHTCGKTVIFYAPLVVMFQKMKQAIVCPGLTDQARADAQNSGWQITEAEDYGAVLSIVLGWIQQETAAFWKIVFDGSYHRLTVRQAVAAMSPVQLVAMKLARDKVLAVAFGTAESGGSLQPGSDDMVESLNNATVGLTEQHVRNVIRAALLDGKGGQLREEFERRVPAKCLDEAVLEALLERASRELPSLDDVLDDHIHLGADHILEPYYAIIGCALAWQTAGRDNPVEEQLARLFILISVLDARGDVAMDQRLWLVPALLRTLVSAETVRLILGILSAGNPRSLLDREANPGLSELSERLGWPEVLADLSRQQLIRDLSQLAESPSPENVIDMALAQAAHLPGQKAAPESDDHLAHFERDRELGDFLADVSYTYLQAVRDRPGAAAAYDRLIHRIQESANPVVQFNFHAAMIYEANLNLRTDISMRSVQFLLDLIDSSDDLPESRIADVLIDVGNTYRYTQQWAEALFYYDKASELNDARMVNHAKRASVIARNRGIVLRDSGRLGEAEEELLAHVQQHPDDPTSEQSLLALFERVGRPKDVLARSTAWLARPGLDRANRYRFLLLQATAHQRLGHHNSAAQACREAAGLLPPGDPRRLMVDAAALLSEPTEPELLSFIDDCERDVINRLPTAIEESWSGALIAGTFVALRRLRMGRFDEAMELLDFLVTWLLEDDRQTPWQLDFALGWYAYATNKADAHLHLVAAVAGLDEHLPLGNEAAYAVGVLTDPWVDDLQRIASRTVAAAIAAGTANIDDLVSVLDVANGRDLTARATVKARIPNSGTETLSGFEQWQRSSNCDVVAILDDTDTLQLLVEGRDHPRRLIDTGIPIPDVKKAVRSLSRFEYCMPEAPERQDKLLTPWWDAAAVVADAVRKELPSSRELILLPGRLLATAPLHAAGWPGLPLIAERPVSVAPNHRLLVGHPVPAESDNPGRSRWSVIAIPKASDQKPFHDALGEVLKHLKSDLPESVFLYGKQGDEAAVLNALGEADCALILCHGAHGGPHLGHGICVASDGILPPFQLSVASEPHLANFVLTWDDLMRVERSPDVVVSIACSTGRTIIGQGGSHLGLEYGLLANATRFSIAPLWSVDQMSALHFVRSFMGTVTSHNGQGAEPDSSRTPLNYRAAVLETMKRFEHPYHWAPFTLSTSLRGGPS